MNSVLLFTSVAALGIEAYALATSLPGRQKLQSTYSAFPSACQVCIGLVDMVTIANVLIPCPGALQYVDSFDVIVW